MPIQLQVDKPSGIYKDVPSRELPDNAWTDGNNIQFVDLKTKKRRGQKESLFAWGFATTPDGGNTGDGTVSGESAGTNTVEETFTLTCTDDSGSGDETFSVVGSVSGTLADATVGVQYVTPEIEFTINDGATDFVIGDTFSIVITKNESTIDINWLIPWDTPTNQYWAYASLTKASRWDGTQHEDITRTSGGDYSAAADQLWTGGILGDVLIMNNGNDLPQYMTTSDSDLQDFPTGGNDWDVNWRCKALRPFKQYLVALNITEGADGKPQNVIWSTAADPNNIPQWGIADPTLEAGETTLSQSDGEVVDGLSLGDSFIIYKTDAVWGMQLIGGQFVMRFYQIFDDVGLLNQNCVASYEGKHFCVGPNDVYVHSGSQKKSVISGKIRRTLFQRLDDNKINRSYVVPDYRNREMLFCYVKASTDATYPNEAMVWNWESNELSFRTLPESGFIAYGQVEDAPLEYKEWDKDGEAWESDNSEWGEIVGKPTERRLLIPDTANQKFYAEGRSTQDGGNDFIAFVERTGLESNNPTTIKHVYEVIPTVVGSGTVDIYVGGEFNPSSGVSWSGPFPYRIGQDYKINCSVSGRSLAIRFESDDAAEWEISSYVLEGEVSGKY